MNFDSYDDAISLAETCAALAVECTRPYHRLAGLPSPIIERPGPAQTAARVAWRKVARRDQVDWELRDAGTMFLKSVIDGFAADLGAAYGPTIAASLIDWIDRRQLYGHQHRLWDAWGDALALAGWAPEADLEAALGREISTKVMAARHALVALDEPLAEADDEMRAIGLGDDDLELLRMEVSQPGDYPVLPLDTYFHNAASAEASRSAVMRIKGEVGRDDWKRIVRWATSTITQQRQAKVALTF